VIQIVARHASTVGYGRVLLRRSTRLFASESAMNAIVGLGDEARSVSALLRERFFVIAEASDALVMCC
jgi:hypothetical protein